MTSPPLDCTHGRTTSGVSCHHRLWEEPTIKRRQEWHEITAFGQHIRSNDVRREMPSPPLDNTLGKTTSGVACHLYRWAAHTVERRWACHDITSLGQHTQSIDVGRGMTSPSLNCTHGRMTSGMAFHHRLWAAHTVGNVGSVMTSPPLGNTYGRTTSSVA